MPMTMISDLRKQLRLKKQKELSPIPSKALRQVCDDIEKYIVEEKRIRFRGNNWCTLESSRFGAICSVCLGGITMLLGRCDIPESHGAVLGHSGGWIYFSACNLLEARHLAFDAIRAGDVLGALQIWFEWLSQEAAAQNEADTRQVGRALEALELYLDRDEDLCWAEIEAIGYSTFDSTDDLERLRRLADYFESQRF